MVVLPDQGEATRIVLVRHAETEEAARGRCYGRLDIPLSPRGLLQAQALADVLGLPPLGDGVEIGESLVRFLGEGPQGRPQLEAELFL
jgi:hypothetical protein